MKAKFVTVLHQVVSVQCSHNAPSPESCAAHFHELFTLSGIHIFLGKLVVLFLLACLKEAVRFREPHRKF
jgi:hypothetical protein